MKNLLLAFLLFFVSQTLKAQTDSLEHYTGKFLFPDGSPVTEINVIIENGTLVASSAIGNSELRKTDTKDVFEVVAYAGTATFKRNDQNKVISLLIQVQDITMEGTKSLVNGMLTGLLEVPLELHGAKDR
jgi:hypothetical protein